MTSEQPQHVLPAPELACRAVGDESAAGQPRDIQAADRPDYLDIVEEWGRQSFPASDPPANW